MYSDSTKNSIGLIYGDKTFKNIPQSPKLVAESVV